MVTMASSSEMTYASLIQNILEVSSDDGSLDCKRNRPRKQRKELKREDFQNAPWQRMIDSGSYKDTSTRHGGTLKGRIVEEEDRGRLSHGNEEPREAEVETVRFLGICELFEPYFGMFV